MIVHRIGTRLEATGNSKNRTVQGSRKVSERDFWNSENVKMGELLS